MHIGFHWWGKIVGLSESGNGRRVFFDLMNFIMVLCPRFGVRAVLWFYLKDRFWSVRETRMNSAGFGKPDQDVHVCLKQNCRDRGAAKWMFMSFYGADFKSLKKEKKKKSLFFNNNILLVKYFGHVCLIVGFSDAHEADRLAWLSDWSGIYFTLHYCSYYEQTWSLLRGLEPASIWNQSSNVKHFTAFALHRRCSWYFHHDIRTSGADHSSRTSINMICLTLSQHLGRAEAQPCSAAVPAVIPFSLTLTSPADICIHLEYLDFKDQGSDKKKGTKQNERNDETRKSTDLERHVNRVHVTIKHNKYNKNKSN